MYSYPSEEMCELSAKTMGSEDFTLAYFAKIKAFSFILTNARATSLADGQKVTLLIAFIKSGKADLGWGRRQFETHKVDDRVAFSSPLLPAPID